jgi:EthD domain-containing protein
MLKTFLLLWKRDDFTRAEFIDYYETRHAPLGSSLIETVDYRRNYPIWSQSTAGLLGDFTVINEVWHDSHAAFERQGVIRRTSPVKELIDADEEKFIDRPRKLKIAVGHEVVQDLDEAEPVRHKILRFVRKPEGTDPDDFRTAYERDTAPAVVAALTGAVSYRRNYVITEDVPGELNPAQPKSGLFQFDLVEEIWSTKNLATTVWPEGGCVVPVEERRLAGGRFVAPLVSA